MNDEICFLRPQQIRIIESAARRYKRPAHPLAQGGLSGAMETTRSEGTWL